MGHERRRLRMPVRRSRSWLVKAGEDGETDNRTDRQSACPPGPDRLATVTSGGTPKRGRKSYWDGNIPWVTTSQINFCQIDRVAEYITEEGLRNSAAKLFPKGTILIALYGQGQTRGRVGILRIEASTNQACGAIQVDTTKASSAFIFYSLQARYDAIRNLSNDGGQKNLRGAIVKRP
jgi:type I restriction enzyme S subunit